MPQQTLLQLTQIWILSAVISTVLCDKQDKAETLLENCEDGKISVLKTIILMDSFGHELTVRGVKCGVDILQLKDIEVGPVEE